MENDFFSAKTHFQSRQSLPQCQIERLPDGAIRMAEREVANANRIAYTAPRQTADRAAPTEARQAARMKHPDQDHTLPNSPPAKRVGALSAGLSVLRYLNRHGKDTGAGVSHIARELGLNPSTCFNILRTLVFERMVNFDPVTKTYRLGLGNIELAKGAIDQASYTHLMRADLDSTAATHHVTAGLWQPSGNGFLLLVTKSDGDAMMRVHMNVGQRIPQFISAAGRCMAAFSGVSRREVQQAFRHLRWEQEPGFEDYWASVEQVRERGYAQDIDQYVRGVSSVSAPVLGPAGRPIAMLSNSSITQRMPAPRLSAIGIDLRSRTRALSQALSGQTEARAGR